MNEEASQERIKDNLQVPDSKAPFFYFMPLRAPSVFFLKNNNKKKKIKNMPLFLNIYKRIHR
jgi:hypothetical protein